MLTISLSACGMLLSSFASFVRTGSTLKFKLELSRPAFTRISSVTSNVNKQAQRVFKQTAIQLGEYVSRHYLVSGLVESLSVSPPFTQPYAMSGIGPELQNLLNKEGSTSEGAQAIRDYANNCSYRQKMCCSNR